MKIIAKIILSRIPFGYDFWQRLGLFRLGKMDQASYALAVFNTHAKLAFPQGVPKGLVMMELGPGDSLASALVASAFGASKIIMADVGNYARRDLVLYQSIAVSLRTQGLPVPDISSVQSIDEMLDILNAQYITTGLDGLRSIPDRSVDFIWSHSVLEHVRKRDFSETMRQTRRILKPDGIASHNVNFKDHLGEALHNLRFSDKVWESEFLASSGFYTNRIRAFQMRDMMEKAGFKIRSFETGSWDKIPTPRTALHPDFQKLPDEELRICTCHAVLAP